MRYTKMRGAGTEYVCVDSSEEDLPADLPNLARRISDRHDGIGSHGLVLIGPSKRADSNIRILAACGTELSMCGRAIRCVAKYLRDRSVVSHDYLTVETREGVFDIYLQIGGNGQVRRVTVDRGLPDLNAARIPTTMVSRGMVVGQSLDVSGVDLELTCVWIGQPHCVVFVDSLGDRLVFGLGPEIAAHSAFPDSINVDFVRVISRSEVVQRTWRRESPGRAAGEASACDTGAMAACVAGYMTDRTERKILSRMLGGNLIVEWARTSDCVLMTGGAEEILQGNYEP